MKRFLRKLLFDEKSTMPSDLNHMVVGTRYERYWVFNWYKLFMLIFGLALIYVVIFK